MSQFVTSDKCPRCGGKMQYDSTVRKFHCSHCDTYIDAQYAPMADGSRTQMPASLLGTALYDYLGVGGKAVTGEAINRYADGWGAEESTHVCRCCGAPVHFGRGWMNARCEYCDSEMALMDGVRSGSLEPAGIIPFAVNAEGLEPELRYRFFNNILVPKPFKQLASAERMKQTYLPLWIFDVSVEADFAVAYGDEGKMLRSTARGRFTKAYNGLCTAAAADYRDLLDPQLENYRVNNNVPYAPKYTAGYNVVRYNVPLETAWTQVLPQIREKVQGDIAERVCSHFRKAQVRIDQLNLRFTSRSYRYILVPLWTDSIPYKGKTYRFGINGQTGSFAGDYPALFK